MGGLIPDIQKGAIANAALWRPMRNALAGADDVLVRHMQDDPTAPALEIWNEDETSTAPYLWARVDDTRTIEGTRTSLSLRSPDGTKSIVISDAGVSIVGIAEDALQQSLVSDDASKSVVVSNSGTAVTGPLSVSTALGVTGAATFASTVGVTGALTVTGSVAANGGLAVTGALTVNGNTIGSGYRVYNVLDHGITPATNSVGVRAANVTAFQTLWTAVATNGGGTIYFPENQYYFDPCALNHGLSFTSVVNVMGDGYATAIRLVGTAGPFWDIASNSSSLVTKGFIRDLTFYNESTVTSGANIRLGGVTNYTIENVNMLFQSDATSAYTCIQYGMNGLTCGNLTLRQCILENRGDAANAPIVHVTGNSLMGGLSIETCSLQGGGGVGYSNNNTICVLFNNTNAFDSFWFVHSGFATAKYGIYVAGNSVVNGIISDCFIDAIATTGILLQSDTGKVISTWQITNSWINANSLGIELDRGAGVIRNIIIHGNYFTEGDAGSITLDDGTRYVVMGNVFESSLAGAGNVIGVGSAEAVVIANNNISVSSAATASINVDASCTPVAVTGNVMRGKDLVFGGSTSAARVNASNAFLA